MQVKYGNLRRELALTLREGERGSADLFWAQDAGALGAVAKAGLFSDLPAGVGGDLPALFRHAGGKWVATSGRARTIAYSTERVKAESLPKGVFDLTNARYRGKVAWAPSNASFQAFVTAMRKTHGEDTTRTWLADMKKNGAHSYPNNVAILQAIARGEADYGLPNHYYLLNFKKSEATQRGMSPVRAGSSPATACATCSSALSSASATRRCRSRSSIASGAPSSAPGRRGSMPSTREAPPRARLRAELRRLGTRPLVLLAAIALVGAALRLYGVDWDDGGHLHPDERYLTMVADQVAGRRRSGSTSTSSPPRSRRTTRTAGAATCTASCRSLTTKLVAAALDRDTYDQVHLVGRVLSALVDTASIVLVFLIARLLLARESRRADAGALLAAAFYALTVTAIQHAHFFTIESWLVLATLVTFLAGAPWSAAGGQRSRSPRSPASGALGLRRRRRSAACSSPCPP